MIIFIFAILPQFIESSASDYKCWIDLDPIWPEVRVLKKLLETLEISSDIHVGQVRHHVRHNFVSTILCYCECFLHRLDCMTSVRIPGNVFIYALYSDLQSSAPIREHVRHVSLLAKVGPSFNRNSNAFGLALLRKLNSFLVVG